MRQPRFLLGRLRDDIRSLVVAFTAELPEPPDDAPRIGLSLDGFWLNAVGATRVLFARALALVGARLVPVPRTAAGDPPQPARVAEIVDGLDALVIGGGGDPHPRLYGGDSATANQVDRLADALQLELLRQAGAVGLPALGVCRGLQLMNVERGGSLRCLAEDKELERKHFLRLGGHELVLEADSWIARALGKTRCEGAMSTHRHALDRLGEGVQPVGWADAERREIEAVEITRPAWTVGVMWHPERESLHDPDQLGPFRALVAAALKRQSVG